MLCQMELESFYALSGVTRVVICFARCNSSRYMLCQVNSSRYSCYTYDSSFRQRFLYYFDISTSPTCVFNKVSVCFIDTRMFVHYYLPL